MTIQTCSSETSGTLGFEVWSWVGDLGVSLLGEVVFDEAKTLLMKATTSTMVC